VALLLWALSVPKKAAVTAAQATVVAIVERFIVS